MNIFEGSAAELERWFHLTDRQHFLMCFLVAARAADRQLFKSLIDEVVHMDSVLGEKISFILFKEPSKAKARTRRQQAIPPGISLNDSTDKRGNRVRAATVMAGEILRPTKKKSALPRLIDEVYDVRSLTKSRSPVRRTVQELVVNSSHKIIPDLCEHFEVSFDKLPAIVVLAKGVRERFLFQLRQETAYQEILDFVTHLATILRERDVVIQSRIEMKARIQELENALQRIESRSQEIDFAVEGLRRKHNLADGPLNSFLLAIRAGQSDLSFRRIIAEMPDSDSALKDARVAKVDRLLNEIRDVHLGMKDIVGDFGEKSPCLRGSAGREVPRDRGEIVPIERLRIRY